MEADNLGNGSEVSLLPEEPVKHAKCPLVSVVIPAYQCSQYIAQAVESVLSQSYPNYEVIVINDGSPDTPALEAALAPFMDRILYVKQTTRGPSGARNAGIRQARGKYVAFLDGDDHWSTSHLSKQMVMFERDPGLALTYCDCVLVREEKPFNRYFTLQPQSRSVTFESLIVEDCAISTSSTLVLREALIATGMFDENFRRSEDFDLWLRMSFRGCRMAYHPDAEVYHRVNEAGLSANKVAMKRDLIRVYGKIASTLNISSEQARLIDARIAKTESECHVEEFKRALEDGDYTRALQLSDGVKEAGNHWKLKVSSFALRIAPRLFRLLYLGRSVASGHGRFSGQSRGREFRLVTSEERFSPAIHKRDSK
jgi:glycosyltransferase involved in cell wall biosynthesis